MLLEPIAGLFLCSTGHVINHRHWARPSPEYWPSGIVSMTSDKKFLGTNIFAPSTIPSRDREHLLTVKSDVRLTDYTSFYSKGLLILFPLVEIKKQLLGCSGKRFLLFGMLIHSKEGKLCLEGVDGVVELDFSQLVGSGFFPNSYFR